MMVMCPACKGGRYKRENHKCSLCRGREITTKEKADNWRNKNNKTKNLNILKNQ
jgi:DnaJ-class molecular chaperone